MEGASPRMRGKVFFFTGASFCAIFFLEPSGNLLLEPSGSSWVPPDGSIFVFAIGSPPRVRGKVPLGQGLHHSIGITPAYAGKSRSSSYSKVTGLGSPPRMRGKELPAHVCLERFGITPAYAGKRDLVISGSGDIEDHPRVCGEKNGICRAKVPHLGSPPRVRGKGFLHFAHKMLEGITPAYAGKSTTAGRGRMPSRDHPRVCGEKLQIAAITRRL